MPRKENDHLQANEPVYLLLHMARNPHNYRSPIALALRTGIGPTPLPLTTVMRALLPSLIRLPIVDFPIGKPMTAAKAPLTISNAVVMVGVRGSTAAMLFTC